LLSVVAMNLRLPRAYAVLLHQLLDTILAHANAAREQFLPDPRPAVFASHFSVNGLDVYEQRVVAQTPW